MYPFLLHSSRFDSSLQISCPLLEEIAVQVSIEPYSMNFIFKIKILLAFIVSQLLLSGISSAAVEYDELVAFAKQLENSIASGNPRYFNLCFDTEGIIQKVIVTNNDSINNAFNEGFIEGVRQEFDLGAGIIELTSSEGSFSFIRAYQKNGKSKILFRLISAYGIDYHEYEVDVCEGKTVIVDGYIFTSAQTISNIFEQIYTQYLLTLHRFVEQRPVKDINLKIQELAESGKFEKAYKKWGKLPNYIRYSKSNQLLGINLATELDKEVFFGTYIEFMHRFPNEPGKYLVTLNGLVKHGYYQAALNNIDKLDETVQNDPMLDIIRANVYYELGNATDAEICLNRLIESMPEYENGYINLLGLYLEEKEFIKATQLLDKIIFTFDTSKEDLIPIFSNHPDFMNSTEYRNWLEN